MGTLREATIRLAQDQPDLRRDLLNLLVAAKANSNPGDLSTRGILAAVYRASDPRSMLTHSYDEKQRVVLCGRVQVDSLTDAGGGDDKAAPTCKTCLKRDPRF